MIVFVAICLIFLAGLGTCANYLGVSAVMTAFELTGGSAIEMFCFGVASIIISLIDFGWVSMNVKLIIDEIRGKAPTADVVPKSEVDWNSIPVDVSEALKQRAVEKAKTDVAREIFEDIENEIHGAIKSNVKAIDERKTKTNGYEDYFVARCHGKIAALRDIDGFVKELKEKYTEGDDEQ